MRAEMIDQYNVVWDSPSKNSSESMPVGGHSIGLNVWVENGDVLFYMQRSGSLSENGEYLKLGRIRLRLQPSPFERGSTFRQESTFVFTVCMLQYLCFRQSNVF